MAIISPDRRQAALSEWLRAHFGETVRLRALGGDASFRRYFRLRARRRSWLAVDSPPPENLAQCIASGDVLRRSRAMLPAIYAFDTDNGFALLQDFGDDLYFRLLRKKTGENADEKTAEELYGRAMAALIQIQSLPARGLPRYRRGLLADELNLFDEWYCSRHRKKPLSPGERAVFARAVDFLIESMLAHPQVAVHRDYHSRNLIRVAGCDAPGILDWQDAVIGSAAYDMASLLRDAYIEWPRPLQRRWLQKYWRLARAGGIPLPARFEEFWRQFNVAAVQRGLKVLGIFARLAHRDRKPGYQKDMPRVRRHLLVGCRALPELGELTKLIAGRASCR